LVSHSLDGDYYESAIQIVEALCHKVSSGRCVIVDDYLHLEASNQAVDDFRVVFSVTEEIVAVDWNSVYWRQDLR
jgi:hypothetical protein